MAGYLLLFAIGVVILLFSTEYLAKISSKMWAALKLSPLIIGCTIVAIGTSLPEMAVSLTAVLKGDQGLATGNIVGSNIANILLVFAVGIFLGHINIGISKTQKTGLMMLLATGLYLWLSFTVASPQVLGVILVGLAILFSLLEIFMGMSGRNHEDKAFVAHKNSRFGPAMIGKVMVVVAGVILGGMIVVYSIEELSLVSGYSTTILGLSVTAIATSLPELLTVVFCRDNLYFASKRTGHSAKIFCHADSFVPQPVRIHQIQKSTHASVSNCRNQVGSVRFLPIGGKMNRQRIENPL